MKGLNRKLTLMAAILAGFALAGCSMVTTVGSGVPATDTREVGAFNTLNIDGVGNVYYAQSSNTSLRIESEDNLLKLIDTEVTNGTLTVRPQNIIPTLPLNIYITAPSLSNIVLNGNADITCDNDIAADSFSVAINGSGNVKCKVYAKTISSTISGSGNITLIGSGSDYTASIIGSGEIKCKDLTNYNATVTITGSGNCNIFATGRVNATITGSGNIYLYASPASLNQNITGSGNVTINK